MKRLKIPKGQSESVYQRRTDKNSYLMDIGPQQSLRFSDRKYTTENIDPKWSNRVWQPHFAHLHH
jgi:hypothetical protein